MEDKEKKKSGRKPGTRADRGYSPFANSLFKLRTELRLDYDQFAKPIIIDDSSIAGTSVRKYEREKMNSPLPSFDTLKAISTAYNVDIGYLMGEYEEKKRTLSDIRTLTGLSETACETISDSYYRRTGLLDKVLSRFFDIDSALLEIIQAQFRRTHYLSDQNGVLEVSCPYEAITTPEYRIYHASVEDITLVNDGYQYCGDIHINQQNTRHIYTNRLLRECIELAKLYDYGKSELAYALLYLGFLYDDYDFSNIGRDIIEETIYSYISGCEELHGENEFTVFLKRHERLYQELIHSIDLIKENMNFTDPIEQKKQLYAISELFMDAVRSCIPE